MQFTILTVNPEGRNPSIETISELAMDAVQQILPVTFVPYESFKLATESEPISLYIIDKKDKSIMSKEIKDIRSLQHNFFGSKKLGSFTAPMTHSFNPRYAVLDVHDISEEGYKDKFAIRLLMSDKIPVSHYIIARNIADIISMEYQTTVFSISKEHNTIIECVSKIQRKQELYHSLSRENSGIIGRYTKSNNISINKILSRLDRNVEVLMAPTDLEEYEGSLRDHEASMEYIKTLDESEQSKEMRQIRKDIMMLKSEIASLISMIKEEPKVISSYIRIFNPSELSKYKVRDVELNQSTKEVWS